MKLEDEEVSRILCPREEASDTWTSKAGNTMEMLTVYLTTLPIIQGTMSNNKLINEYKT
jgi:hypothetical protein